MTAYTILPTPSSLIPPGEDRHRTKHQKSEDSREAKQLMNARKAYLYKDIQKHTQKAYLRYPEQ